jgi:ketosteroid isomerase-like protein
MAGGRLRQPDPHRGAADAGLEAKGDNLTKTGVRYDNDYCMVWRLENGKVKEIREYCDSALVERVRGPFPAEALARAG